MTGEQRQNAADPRCIELVELLTAYLDDALADETRREFDEHLEGCAGCWVALAQWRTTVRLAGRLRTADVADLGPYVRDRLLATLVRPRRR